MYYLYQFILRLLLFSFFYVALSPSVVFPQENKCSKTLKIAFPNVEYGEIPKGLIDPVYVDIAIVKAVLEIAGCEYRLIDMPWNRVMTSIKRGTIDGSFDVSKTKERLKFGRFSKSYRQELAGFVMRKKDVPAFTPSSFKDIVSSGYKIASNSGYWYGHAFDNALKSDAAFRKRVLRIDYDDGFEALLNKQRVDIFFVDVHGALFLLKKKRWDNSLAVHPYILNSDSLHLFLSNITTTEHDLDIINDAIAMFMLSPKYASLMRFLNTFPTEGQDRDLLVALLSNKKTLTACSFN